jgi:plastocyanin
VPPNTGSMTRRSSWRATPFAMLLTVAVAACGNGEPVESAASAKPQIVVIKDFTFTPALLEVRSGEKIDFENDDSQAHTATSDESSVFDTSSIAASTTATPLAIGKPGKYTYHCSFHPFMKATIAVA